jgi:hypothetical protein
MQAPGPRNPQNRSQNFSKFLRISADCCAQWDLFGEFGDGISVAAVSAEESTTLIAKAAVFPVAALFGVAAMCAATGAHANDCDTVMTATLAQMKAPYRATISFSNLNGKPATSETVFTGGKMYVQLNGAWQVSPITAQEMTDQMKKNYKESKESCRYVGDESVDGQAASIFTASFQSPRSHSDNRIWISRSRGVLLKTWARIDEGNQTMTSTYEYDNIQPPAGVK